MAQKPSPLAKHSLDVIDLTLRDVKSLSESGFDEISAIARMATLWLESPHQCANPNEVIKHALNLIWSKACEMDNSIGCQLETLGIFTEGDAA